MKKIPLIISFVMFFALLSGCGDGGEKQPIVDKQTFIMEMESHMFAVQNVETEIIALFTELMIMIMFPTSLDQYEEQLIQLRKEYDQVIKDAAKISLPEDKNGQQLYKNYVELMNEKNDLINELFALLADSNFPKFISLMTKIEVSFNKRMENFEQLWYAYKTM